MRLIGTSLLSLQISRVLFVFIPFVWIAENIFPDAVQLFVISNDVVLISSLPAEIAKSFRTDTLRTYRLDLANDGTQ